MFASNVGVLAERKNGASILKYYPGHRLEDLPFYLITEIRMIVNESVAVHTLTKPILTSLSVAVI